MAGGKPKKQWYIGAGSMAVVLGVAAWVALGSDDGDDDASDVATGAEGYLVAGELPDDWEITAAATPETLAVAEPPENQGTAGDAGEAPADQGAAGVAGEVVVYGDGDLDEPWTGPVLAVTHFDAAPSYSSGISPPASVPSDEVDVGDRSYLVYEIEDMVSAGDSDNNIRVAGYGVERGEVDTALEHVDSESGVDEDGLPDGFEEIARGPYAATGMTLNRADISEGLALGYGRRPLVYTSSPPDVMMTQQPADADAAGLLRLLAREPLPYGREREVDVEMTEVRGNEAHVLRYHEADLPNDDVGTAVTYQWFEPAVGQVVTLTGIGVDQRDIDTIVAGLRIGSDAELDELLAGDYPWLEPEPECAPAIVAAGAAESAPVEGGGSGGADGGAPPPPEDLYVPEGAERLASGQERGMSWQLSIEEERDGCGSLSLATAQAQSTRDSTMPFSTPLSSAQTDTVGSSDAGVVGIFGLVADEVAEVRVEHSDGESYPLELHALDSFDVSAFVGVVPPESWTLTYELVALDEDGNTLDEWTPN